MVRASAHSQRATATMPPASGKRAAREAAAKTLYACDDEAQWAAALAAAPAAADAAGELGRLDAEYYDSLPRALRQRAGGGGPKVGEKGGAAQPSTGRVLAALTKADVVATVDWKLRRGTWRPSLAAYARALDEEEVRQAAAAAGVAWGSGEGGCLRGALESLCTLKGVGPATATALVSLADRSVPFLSDEAAVAALGVREYTLPAALGLTEALRDKAAALGPAWTARGVERALWAASREGEARGGGGSKPAAVAGGGRPAAAAAAAAVPNKKRKARGS